MTDSLLILLLYGCAVLINGRSVFKNYDFVKGYKRTSVIFLVSTLIIVLIFYKELLPFLKGFTILPFLILTGFYAVIFALYKRMKVLVDSNIVKQHQSSGVYLTAMDYRFIISKSFDILFQQTLCLIGLALLMDMHISILWITIFFIAIVTFSHSLIIRMSLWYGLYTTINSPFAVIVSLFLILHIHYGFVYSYMLHWIFYLIGGVGFNLLSSRPFRAKLLGQ